MFADQAFGDQAVYDREEIEDVGIPLSNNAPNLTEGAEKPHKEVKAYVRAEEPETAPAAPEKAEEVSKTKKKTTKKAKAEPSTPSPETMGELAAARDSITVAAEMLELSDDKLKGIYLEVSGKEDLETVTELDELDTIFKYLEEIEKQDSGKDKIADGEQLSFDDVLKAMPGAKKMTPVK
jgi:hypothetical protein